MKKFYNEKFQQYIGKLFTKLNIDFNFDTVIDEKTFDEQVILLLNETKNKKLFFGLNKIYKEVDKKITFIKNVYTIEEVEKDIDPIKVDYKKLLLEKENEIDNLKLRNEKLEITIDKNARELITIIKEKEEKARAIISLKNDELELKKQTELKERQKVIASNIVLEFLEPISMFEKIVEVPTDNDVIKNYLMGFKMILNTFEDSLITLKVVSLDIKIGDQFDPKKMEAFDSVDNSEFESNTVIKIIKQGYSLEDKIIRYAVVVVAK